MKVWLAGRWSDHAELRAQLVAHEGLGIVDDALVADAIVFATDGSGLRGELARLREHTSAPVVVVAQRSAGDLLDAAFEAGVADVLLLPQTADSIAFAIEKAVAATARRDGATTRAQIVTVFSPKGGTGKTAIATNLAAALARTRRVLLVDLDLQFGDVAIDLGLQPERTIHELLTAPGPVDADKISGYATTHSRNLDVLAAPLKPEDAESVTDTRVGELLRGARDGYDVVIVDTPSAFHGPVLTTFDRTDHLFVVCTPEVAAMKNVRLALQTLRLLSFPDERLRLVLNRANEHVGFRAPEVASILERDVAHELPEDQFVGVAANRAETLVDFADASPFAVGIAEVAQTLLGGAEHAAVAPSPSRRRRLALGRRA